MIPKKANFVQLNPTVPVDRISDLPDVILHHIISFLSREEAYRNTVLSKRWTQITTTNTNPVLEFRLNMDSKETTASFLDRVDPTMQRYSKENIRIRQLKLDFIGLDVEFVGKVDEWLGIALNSQVSELFLIGPEQYKLPDVLFSAKSLTHLVCFNITVDERLLNHVISSCLSLTILRLSFCYEFEHIVIPRHSKLETPDLIKLPMRGEVIVESSSLKNFHAKSRRIMGWPIISDAGLLRNLKTLQLSSSDITDEDLALRLSELILLETLMLQSCNELCYINISSTRLLKFCLDDCGSLSDVAVAAPNLKKFVFSGEHLPSLSVTINNQSTCGVSLHTLPDNFDTDGFLELKKLLTGLNSNNVSLKIVLIYETFQFELFPTSSVNTRCDFIEFDEEDLDDEELDEEVEKVHLGPPCEIRKLKLNFSSWMLSDSSLSAFLDGLFWSCRPHILSLRVELGSSNEKIQPLIQKLKKMARCWRHPLKRVEGGNNCFNLLKPWKNDIELRLYW